MPVQAGKSPACRLIPQGRIGISGAPPPDSPHSRQKSTMVSFFFYGTLLDPDVRRGVFQEGTSRFELAPAELYGFRRVRAREGSYPVLVRAKGGRVRGALADELDRDALLRIAHFEGPGYLPCPVSLRTPDGRREAWTLLPNRRRCGGAEAWSLHVWQRREKARAMHQILAWFAEPTVGSPHSIDISWRMRRWIDVQIPASGERRL